MTPDPAALWAFLHSDVELLGPWLEEEPGTWTRDCDPRDASYGADPITVAKIHITKGYFCPKGCQRAGTGAYCQRCGEPTMYDTNAKPWTTYPLWSPRIFADTADEAKALVDARLVAEGYLLVPQPPDAE